MCFRNRIVEFFVPRPAAGEERLGHRSLAALQAAGLLAGSIETRHAAFAAVVGEHGPILSAEVLFHLREIPAAAGIALSGMYRSSRAVTVYGVFFRTVRTAVFPFLRRTVFFSVVFCISVTRVILRPFCVPLPRRSA